MLPVTFNLKNLVYDVKVLELYNLIVKGKGFCMNLLLMRIKG